MVREIENIFLDFPGYGCFACDPRNKLGLRMKFYADDEKGEVFTKLRLEEHLSGFPGILHGGIQCALVDEVAFWAMFDKLKKIGVTMRVEMDFVKKVDNPGALEIRGRIEQIRDRRVTVKVNIYDGQNNLATRSRVTYFIPKREMLYRIMGEERFTEKFQGYIED
ncbi:MAG TPA: PaaI family thioesterase [Thermodesulfobacteriota bacterium]|jgi:acyl-coenzyme A thioesterase PaaI-like protein